MHLVDDRFGWCRGDGAAGVDACIDMLIELQVADATQIATADGTRDTISQSGDDDRSRKGGGTR